MMKDFCHRCGRELEEGALVCPDCGTPTDKGMQDPVVSKQYHAKPLKVPIIVLCVLAALVVVSIVAPMILPGETTYNTTITVEEISIDDSLDGLYTEWGDAKAFITVTVNGETVDVPSGKDNYWTVSTDGTVKTLTSDNTYTFKNTGNNPTLMIFFETYAPHLDDGTGEVKEGDTIDIYAEKNADRVVENFGATGIYFDMKDVDENGYIELRGDAQPLGYIKLKISVDKAQA